MGNIIIGIVGSVLGGCLFHFFGVSMGGGIIGSIIVATIGAVALIFTSRIINHA
ncbi:MAG: GlsB/YeaQ/YmgE family stress response membrane protein [Endomicrobiaceae bacterium]|nr:GlsB/YeaQ/YmgE family stress response membrane protein [Endomicrobiaceae bacterium]